MAKKNLKTLRHAQGLHPERSRRIRRGVFITFEGPEGCGKSTHSKFFYEHLKKRGYICVHTREPGGTRMGERIRDILLSAKDIPITDLAEAFLFEASRAQIVDEVIRPALAKRKIVICDRFSDATLAYQGCGGRLGLDRIETLNEAATAGLTPDLTILLDIDTATGLKRATKKGIDRMEAKEIAYHRRVRAGYLKLARRYPARIKVINTNGPVAVVQSMIRSEAELVIQKNKRTGSGGLIP